MINPVIEFEDSISNFLVVPLVLPNEIDDHEVIGAETALHHPLAPEDLLLHSFEPGLLASVLLGPLNEASLHASQWFEGVSSLSGGKGR